jgi:hypothetical protein
MISTTYADKKLPMKRQEALAVLHEICNVLKETVAINHVSLDEKNSIVNNSDGYEIKLQCQFEKACWTGIKPILEKYRLGMRVSEDNVIIHSLPAQ